MNDEVKEILIDLIDYYNIIGTTLDPGIEVFAKIVSRSSKALERSSVEYRKRQDKSSGDVDPFVIDAVDNTKEYVAPNFILKHESDF